MSVLSVAPFGVVLDANVLFPLTLRDTLLRAAENGWYQLYWSDQILDEMQRNLVQREQMTGLQGEQLRKQMMQFFPEAMVTGYEDLVDVMRNDPKDRHVVAVAVKIRAEVIVTQNLRDFRQLPDGVEVQSPNQFLHDLFDLHPDGMIELLRMQARDLRNPPHTFEQLLSGLGTVVPAFAAMIREHAG